MQSAGWVCCAWPLLQAVGPLKLVYDDVISNISFTLDALTITYDSLCHVYVKDHADTRLHHGLQSLAGKIVARKPMRC